MPKGIFLIFLVATVLAISMPGTAQVYRCESSGSVAYSDLPCGDSAQEVVLDVPEPATGREHSQAQFRAAAAARARPDEKKAPVISEGERNISQFLNMLHDQRRRQIEEIDQTIASLRVQAESEEFGRYDEARQAKMLVELDRLESSRASILEEYSALIQEAQSRLE